MIELETETKNNIKCGSLVNIDIKTGKIDTWIRQNKLSGLNRPIGVAVRNFKKGETITWCPDKNTKDIIVKGSIK
jgi:hypothetical protein